MQGKEENSILETGRASSLDSPEQGLVGHELDNAVAEHVMGWKRLGNYWMSIGIGNIVKPSKLMATWLPSTSIANAMEVVEKMRERGYGCVLGFNGMTTQQNGAKFFDGFRAAGHSIFDAEPHLGFDAVDASIELAICRAALAAVEANAPA